ncbi:MAG: DNA topoisomerase 3 [Puniceicoccales bacterium]|jgi:DNA topoisomerase-3|nr:DNA topoisomerase 3 [Puniceicoccales bacterium]
MKKLVIAEKPSVARDIVNVLGKFEKNGEFYENDDYVISSAVGHLVELFMPEDIDTNLKKWSLDVLPILPKKFEKKPIEQTKKKFNELKKLMARKDIDIVINACDAGREGELIFTYIYELAGCKKIIKRLWLSSMTIEAIRDGFSRLRTEEEMKNLQYAAKCRSEADWLIGINGTRAVTTKMFRTRAGNVATVGRVQTPTLSMICTREKEITNFMPRDYWRIIGNFGITNGTYLGTFNKLNVQKNDPQDRGDRIWSEEEANKIINEINAAKVAIVSEKKKRTKQNAPRLYDLTTLQREANTRYSMPAGMTLNLAQSLYEKHKCITYPRTDANALPEDYGQTCVDILNSITQEFKEFADMVLKNNWVDTSNKKIFNNKQISDHFAIIPTVKRPTSLSEEESKIYSMIAKRFIAIFFPAAEFDVTTRMSKVGHHEFFTEGKVLAKPGWLTVHGKAAADPENETIPALSEQDGEPAKANVIEVRASKEATKPPPRYTEATLLAMMESAGKMVDDEELAEAMKERGLGTPATRAQTIDHLISLKYIERNKRDLIPTPKAEDLFTFLDAFNINILSSPALTGEWEYKLRQMEQGNLDRESFINGIVDLTKDIVEKLKLFNETDKALRQSNLISPSDNLPMQETLKDFRSQDGQIVLPKTLSGRRMLSHELEELLRNKKVGPIDGFRSKLGKLYSATLVLDETGKISFSFEKNTEHADDPLITIEKLQTCEIICKCLCNNCNGNVYDYENAYICENFINKDKEARCTLRIGKYVLGKELSREQAIKLISDGKTDMIDGFRSKKTGRLFSAILIFNQGKLSFEFQTKSKAVNKYTPPNTL